MPAAPTMAAAALGQVGSRPRAGAGLGGERGWGKPLREAHFREAHQLPARPALRRSLGARVPLRGAEEEGAPWQGARGCKRTGWWDRDADRRYVGGNTEEGRVMGQALDWGGWGGLRRE